MPDTDGKFFRVGCGCVQWLVQADGTRCCPMSFQPEPGGDYHVTVLDRSFDGQELKLLEHGSELAMPGGRGFAEPRWRFRRQVLPDAAQRCARFVTTSPDGLHFEPVKQWTFDDGQDLGSYNTQLIGSPTATACFCYTRRGANNDHIAPRRPCFWRRLTRKTAASFAPRRRSLCRNGAELGNFGAARS